MDLKEFKRFLIFINNVLIMYEIIYFLHIIFNIIILILVYNKLKKYDKIFNKIEPKREINLELTNWKNYIINN